MLWQDGHSNLYLRGPLFIFQTLPICVCPHKFFFFFNFIMYSGAVGGVNSNVANTDLKMKQKFAQNSKKIIFCSNMLSGICNVNEMLIVERLAAVLSRQTSSHLVNRTHKPFILAQLGNGRTRKREREKECNKIKTQEGGKKAANS